MLEHKKIQTLDDYFSDLNQRLDRGVYFYRINGYSDEIGAFLGKYYETARRTGVVIEGKIQNPDEKNLAYYNEIMGMNFRMEREFIAVSLRKWLPRMNEHQRDNMAASIYASLDSMRKSGKTENMLKNAYIKFMCWLYYRFERIVNQLGENQLPKLLYDGQISNYELMLISILSNVGCDVVLLQTAGDEPYRRVDPSSALSDPLEIAGLRPFPEGYGVKAIQEELSRSLERERLYGTPPKQKPCTNAWIKGKGLEDIRESIAARGSDPGFFYNCFCRISGAEDKLTYENELFLLQQELKAANRRTVIVSGRIPQPTPEEIAGIRRANYADTEQMLLGLAKNLPGSVPGGTESGELQRIFHRAFVDLMLEEEKEPGENLNRLTNKAVYLLCWLRRYMQGLFSGWKAPGIGCFILLGGCKSDNEALFLRFLARTPTDVLILCPDLNTTCCLKDRLLYEEHYSESLPLTRYPQEQSQVRIGTVAYHAERELDTLMYQDSGMYRNQQFARANVISLRTMYEEIRILWDEELKYRPNFSTADGVVNMPVIFAKVSGVKDGLVPQYWSSVRELITEDTVLIRGAPYLRATDPNPMRTGVSEFYKNGRLQKAKIRAHPSYPYGILREEMQEFMLDKLETLINQRLIRGIGQNGTEYTVVAQALNLPKEIVRLIQRFDFTKKNPKLVYINTGETVISLEDSILTAFLNLIGFDILFFVPTGYQSVEQHFAGNLMEEHQIGEYLYDLQVPDLSNPAFNATRPRRRSKFFKRGN